MKKWIHGRFVGVKKWICRFVEVKKWIHGTFVGVKK